MGNLFEPQSECQLLNISSGIDQMQRAPVVDIDTITYMRRMDAQPEECNMHIDQDHDYLPMLLCQNLLTMLLSTLLGLWFAL